MSGMKDFEIGMMDEGEVKARWAEEDRQYTEMLGSPRIGDEPSDMIRELRDVEIRINIAVEQLTQVIDETTKWWDQQMDSIRQLMVLMAAMGFQVDLDEET